LEPREISWFDLTSLLDGGNGIKREQRWIALAPHLEEEVEVGRLESELLGSISPMDWTDGDALEPVQHEAIMRLLDAGLLLDEKESGVFAARDKQMREGNWWGPAALMHRFGRWYDCDSVASMEADGLTTAAGLCEKLGPPPPEMGRREDIAEHVVLPKSAGDFDAFLARRATCRNFETDRPLPLADFSTLMHRVFAAQARVEADGVAAFLKKNVPSGGGLHAMEAYLVVRHVGGLQAGLYHYDPVRHGIDRLAQPMPDLDVFSRTALAGQHWFAEAPVLVVLVARYSRMYWKYRRHSKAYRALILDAGHLSQLLYLCATEAGMGAFVTSAINEVDIERGFGLDPLLEGPLAICGFGYRASAMNTAEFDPNGTVWEAAVD